MPSLLVNENFPAPATRALRAAGVDVKSIIEFAAGIRDERGVMWRLWDLKTRAWIETVSTAKKTRSAHLV